MLDVLCSTQLPEHGAQRQRFMGHGILLDREHDLEDGFALISRSDENPSPSPPGPAKRSIIGIGIEESESFSEWSIGSRNVNAQ